MIISKLKKLNKKRIIEYTAILSNNQGCLSVDKDFMLVIKKTKSKKTKDFFLDKHQLIKLRNLINKKLYEYKS